MGVFSRRDEDTDISEQGEEGLGEEGMLSVLAGSVKNHIVEINCVF